MAGGEEEGWHGERGDEGGGCELGRGGDGRRGAEQTQTSVGAGSGEGRGALAAGGERTCARPRGARQGLNASRMRIGWMRRCLSMLRSVAAISRECNRADAAWKHFTAAAYIFHASSYSQDRNGALVSPPWSSTTTSNGSNPSCSLQPPLGGHTYPRV